MSNPPACYILNHLLIQLHSNLVLYVSHLLPVSWRQTGGELEAAVFEGGAEYGSTLQTNPHIIGSVQILPRPPAQ